MTFRCLALPQKYPAALFWDHVWSFQRELPLSSIIFDHPYRKNYWKNMQLPCPPFFSFSFCERYPRWQIASLLPSCICCKITQIGKKGQNCRKLDLRFYAFVLSGSRILAATCLHKTTVQCQDGQIKTVQCCSYPGKRKWIDERFVQSAHRLLLPWGTIPCEYTSLLPVDSLSFYLKLDF